MFIIIWLFCQLLTAGVLIPGVLNLISGSDFTAIDFRQQPAAYPGVALWVNFLGSILLFLIPALLFTAVISPEPANYLGIRKRANTAILGWALLAGVAMIFVLPDISEWLQKAGFGDWADELQKERQDMEAIYFNDRTATGLLRNILLLAIVPAFCEEVFFRGVMQKLLRTLSHNKWIAIICTSILFGLVHNSIYNFLPIFIASLILGYVYMETESLWASIFLHFIYNLSQVLVVHITPSGNSMISDSLWIKILIEVIAAAVIILCLKMIYKYKVSIYSERKDQENFTNH